MTIAEKMFVALHDWSVKKNAEQGCYPDEGDFIAGFMAALHSVEAEKEPEWISCEERLPDVSDADCYACVWVFNKGEPSVKKVNWDAMGFYHHPERRPYTHWMPTGLGRPAPPEHKPE